jgi:purine catabolism regulator
VPPTTRSLLAQRPFHLRLIAGAREDDPVLDAPLTWAHSSDLADPTPWLEAGQLLLTDGMQFVDDSSPARAAEYVDRLTARGVRALGFATEILHERIPSTLIEACDARGLPLLEVAERAPFMAIIRHVADVISAEQRERLEWSLRAQRRVASAALRPDGIEAILHELESQLDCWVALFDAVGNQVRMPTSKHPPRSVLTALAEEARATLARGNRAARRLDLAGGVTLQTLGQRAQLRGVLAVGTATPLDAAGNDLVASVIALASIALEQSRELDSARHDLRAGLLELLLSGATDVAARTARRLWGPLPDAPLRVAVVRDDTAGQSMLDELELEARRRRGRLFYARRDDELVAVTGAGETSSVTSVLERHRQRIGISSPVDWAQLARGLDEARVAAERGRPGATVVFDALASDGMAGLLAASGAAAVAHRMLEPLFTTPGVDGARLVATLGVWFAHNCAWDPAARELGVHRHTLRKRIDLAGSTLGLDLERFADRSELWSALEFARR